MRSGEQRNRQRSGDQFPCNVDSPILRELRRIADSCDGRTVRDMVVDLLTDPEFIGLPTYFLNTEADTLSAFQKDLLNSYIKISADPALLRQALTDPDPFRPETRARRRALGDIVASSPAVLTAIAAAAELKAIPSLSSNIEDGVSELATSLTTPLPPVTTTGVQALDNVLLNFRAITQTTAFTNVQAALSIIVQRSDFLPFVTGLPPAARVCLASFSG